MGLKATIDSVRNIDAGIYIAQLEPDEAASLGECTSRLGPYSIIVLEANMAYSEQLQTITFDPSETRVLNVGTSDKAIIIDSKASNPPAAKRIHTHTSPAAPSPATAAASSLDRQDKSPDANKPAPPEPIKTTPPPKPPEPIKTTPPPKPPEPIKTTPPPKASEPIKTTPPPKAVKTPEYELSQPLATGDKLFLSELPPDMRSLGEKLLSEVRKQFPGELSYEPRSGKFDETPEIFWTVKIHPQDKLLRLTVRGTPNLFPDIRGIDLKVDKFGYSAFVVNRNSQIEPALTAIRQGAKNMMA